MKKLTIITFFIIGIIGVFEAKAQKEDLFSFMEDHLSSDEQTNVSKAKSAMSKGDKLESRIKAEDKNNKKYLSKGGKKAEKKSVEAKILRIKQALYYEKAYNLLYSTYSEKVNNSTFIYEDDKEKADRLLEEAATANKSGKSKMKKYKNLKPKDLKKSIKYSKLKGDFKSAGDSYVESVNNCIDAYSIYLDQETKKQLEEEENAAWQNAQSDNTVNSYQSYLSDYPNGKYASEARSRISELEEEERRRAEEEKNRSMQGALVFQVQIAASRKQLTKSRIARMYKKTGEVTMKNYDNWYKYAVGEFKTYDEAKAFEKQLEKRVRGAFVVAYLNGEKVHITEALKITQ